MSEEIGLNEISGEAFDVIILAGQSNCVGYGENVGSFTENEKSKIIYRNPAEDPERPFCFHNSRPRIDRIPQSGFYMYFGERYVKEFLAPGRKLLFWRSAVGGTGFSDNRWGSGDDLFLDSVNTADALVKLNPANKVKAILWHQGETDVYNGEHADSYSDKFSWLIKGYRNDPLIGDVPFIAGDFVPAWKKDNPYSEVIADVIKNVINENKNCAFVSSEGLTGNESCEGIHFDDDSCRIFGKRYFEKYKEILRNIK